MKGIKRFIEDFKQFLLGSTFIDVAIGLLIAGAVKDVATTFTSSFVTPIINYLLSFVGVNPNANEATTIFGISFYIQPFITALVSFVIIMFVAFSILRAYASFKERFQSSDDAEETVITSQEAELLQEIRDLLKKEQ